MENTKLTSAKAFMLMVGELLTTAGAPSAEDGASALLSAASYIYKHDPMARQYVDTLHGEQQQRMMGFTSSTTKGN